MTPVVRILYLTIVNLPNSAPLFFDRELVSLAQLRTNITEVVRRCFPHESSIGLFVPASYVDDYFTQMHLPIVMYCQESLIEKNIKIEKNMDGLLFVTFESKRISKEIIETLQCYTRTFPMLSTKRIIILDVISQSKDTHHKQSLYFQCFHRFWKDFGLFHVIILSVFREITHFYSSSIFAYNPFFFGSSSRPGILLKYNFTEDFVKDLSYRLVDMHGYPLKAIMFPFNFSVHPLLIDHPNSIRGGPDLALRWALESHFNVRFTIHKPRDNEGHGGVANGTATGALADIINNHVDIVFNTKIVKWYNTPKVQFLSPRLHSSLVVMVKKSGRIEGGEVVFYIFQGQVWVWLIWSVFVSCIFSVFITRIRSVLNLDNLQDVGVFSAVFLVLKSTLSISVIRVPKSNSERILMSTCLWLSVILVNVFCGQLFYLMKSKPQLPNIDSLQDLQKSNLPIFSPFQNFMDSFDGLQNTTLHKLKDNLRFKRSKYLGWDSGNSEDTGDGFAILYSSTLIQFQVVAQPELKQFIEQAHFLKEEVLQFALAQIMPVGSIFYDNFNLFIMRIIQRGFFIKWHREYLTFVKELISKPQSRADIHTEEDNPQDLTLNDLRLPFSVLCLGLVASIFSFVIEVYKRKIL